MHARPRGIYSTNNLGYNPRQGDHASVERARQYTDEVSTALVLILVRGTRYQAPIPSPGRVVKADEEVWGRGVYIKYSNLDQPGLIGVLHYFDFRVTWT